MHIHFFINKCFTKTKGMGAFLFSCSVIFRAFRVYHKWRMSDFRLKNLSQILTSTKMESNHFFSHQNNFSFFNDTIIISKRRAYRIMTVIGCFLFALYVVCRRYKDTFVVFRILSSICWSFLMLFGVGVMWYSRKIKEAMLCIRETWIVLFSIIAFSIFNALPDFPFDRFFAILISFYFVFN